MLTWAFKSGGALTDSEKHMFEPRAIIFVAIVGLAAACGTAPETDSEAPSALLVNLAIVEGVEIDEVAWTISGGDMEDMTGTIDTSAPESTVSIELFGIPAGSGYLVEMEALTAEGEFFCKGAASFDVITGIATPVDLALNCIRECHVLFCPDSESECERIDLPDGTLCADGAGSCLDGACQIPGP